MRGQRLRRVRVRPLEDDRLRGERVDGRRVGPLGAVRRELGRRKPADRDHEDRALMCRRLARVPPADRRRSGDRDEEERDDDRGLPSADGPGRRVRRHRLSRCWRLRVRVDSSSALARSFAASSVSTAVYDAIARSNSARRAVGSVLERGSLAIDAADDEVDGGELRVLVADLLVGGDAPDRVDPCRAAHSPRPAAAGCS